MQTRRPSRSHAVTFKVGSPLQPRQLRYRLGADCSQRIDRECFLQLDALIDGLEEENVAGPQWATPSRSPAIMKGGIVANSFLWASPRLPRHLKTVTEGVALASEPREQPRQPGARAKGAGAVWDAASEGPQQSAPQEALTQRFRDADLEQRFRVYQARTLRSVGLPPKKRSPCSERLID